jgi:hypothetical protein
MFCDNCGKTIPDNSPSCGFCGHVFAASAPPSYPGPAGGGPPVSYPHVSIWSRLIFGPFRWVYETLERGSFIRRAVALTLRILAIIVVVTGGIYVITPGLKYSFNFPTSQGTAGGLLVTLLMTVAIAAIFEVLLYRAESVASLGESPFTVIPILSIFSRMVGEIYAILGLTMGVGGCLFIWIAGFSPYSVLNQVAPFMPTPPPGVTFLDGLYFLGIFALFSFVAILLFYFLAESIVLVADIARNVRLLVKAKGAENL